MQLVITIVGAKDARELRRVRRLVGIVFNFLVKRKKFAFLKKKRKIFLTVVLASNAESQKLNKTYRKKNRPTNVLSFGRFKTVRDLRVSRSASIELGEIVIARDVVRHEARAAKTNYYSQFFWVLAHGILHVIGLDHERRGAERRMRELEDAMRQRF